MGKPVPQTLVKPTVKPPPVVAKKVTVAVLFVPYVTLAVAQSLPLWSLQIGAVSDKFDSIVGLPSKIRSPSSTGMPFGKVLGTVYPEVGSGCRNCTSLDVPTGVPGGNGLAWADFACRLPTSGIPNTLSYVTLKPYWMN